MGSELLMRNVDFILNHGVKRDKGPQTLPALATVVFLVMTQPDLQGRSFSSSICPLSGEMDLNLVP